jgi:hypothetical protein
LFRFYSNDDGFVYRNNDMNYIKSTCAKNIKELLQSFDLPCVQVGYCFSDHHFYITPFALFSAITKINLIKFFYPENHSIYLQYIYDQETIKNNDNYLKDPEQFEPISKERSTMNGVYFKQKNRVQKNFGATFNPKNPILYNILDILTNFVFSKTMKLIYNVHITKKMNAMPLEEYLMVSKSVGKSLQIIQL